MGDGSYNKVLKKQAASTMLNCPQGDEKIRRRALWTKKVAVLNHRGETPYLKGNFAAGKRKTFFHQLNDRTAFQKLGGEIDKSTKKRGVLRECGRQGGARGEEF